MQLYLHVFACSWDKIRTKITYLMVCGYWIVMGLARQTLILKPFPHIQLKRVFRLIRSLFFISTDWYSWETNLIRCSSEGLSPLYFILFNDLQLFTINYNYLVVYLSPNLVTSKESPLYTYLFVLFVNVVFNYNKTSVVILHLCHPKH